MNTQIIKYEVPSSSASKDLQIVSTTIAVNYRIDTSRALETWVNYKNGHELRIIEPSTHETLKSITAKYTASELITQRELVKDKVTHELKNSLEEHGLNVIKVSLVNFDFSPEFNKAIEMKMVAEQDKLRMQQDLEKTQIEVQKKVAEANANAESIQLNADANAYKKKAEANAEAYYLQTTSTAQAEAIDRIKQQLSNDYINYWKIENWNGVMPNVMTGSESNLLLGLEVD
jgi:prohibitin 2